MPKQASCVIQVRVDPLVNWFGNFVRKAFCVQLAAWAALAAFTGKADQNTDRWWLKPIKTPLVPTVSGNRSVKNPIDAFILARLQRAGLKPAPEAGALALLRRASYDLTGLPPTPDEVLSFTRKPRPDAYQELIDELLSRPTYGERWARHWLDLTRYADTGGFEKDLPYSKAWRFRDYVIQALNSNKPLDRFLQEQIAGDELWPDAPDIAVATSLFGVGPASQDSALTSTQLEYEWLTDVTDTTGAAFLGLTLGCARCHDHKYDPISQKDYFAMQAYLPPATGPTLLQCASTASKGLTGFSPMFPSPMNSCRTRVARSGQRTRCPPACFTEQSHLKSTG